LIILFEPLGLTGLLIRVSRRFGWRPRADVAAGGLRSAAVGEGSPGVDDQSVPSGSPTWTGRSGNRGSA
jgi:hypothetical protein